MKREGFHDESVRRFPARYLATTIFAGLLLFLFPAGKARPQSLYYAQAAGRPTFLIPDPVEMGFTNVANGDLHLEIPLVTASQRGSLIFNSKMVYDARIWEIVNNGISESGGLSHADGG